ncbi:hypothetical protein PTKIN_Ptkin06aG0052000 [Pterospermum kingtungense]
MRANPIRSIEGNRWRYEEGVRKDRVEKGLDYNQEDIVRRAGEGELGYDGKVVSNRNKGKSVIVVEEESDNNGFEISKDGGMSKVGEIEGVKNIISGRRVTLSKSFVPEDGRGGVDNDSLVIVDSGGLESGRVDSYIDEISQEEEGVENGGVKEGNISLASECLVKELMVTFQDKLVLKRKSQYEDDGDSSFRAKKKNRAIELDVLW